ncbi:MAG: translation elongation factor Ts [Christensenellales bacterium]
MQKALTATDGDMDKAAEYLREQGVNIAAKKASRIASEGLVGAYMSADGKVGALAEINCESDFVANSDPFIALVGSVTKQVAETDPSSLEALLAAPATFDEGTVQDAINNATAKIGEKISLRRFVRMEVDGRAETYIHMSGKIGVLLGVSRRRRRRQRRVQGRLPRHRYAYRGFCAQVHLRMRGSRRGSRTRARNS